MSKVRFVRAQGVDPDWVGIEASVIPVEELEKTDAFFLAIDYKKEYVVIVGEDVYRVLQKANNQKALDRINKRGRMPRLWIPKDWCEKVEEQTDGPP